MFLVDLFSWWYSRGWGWVSRYVFFVRNRRILEFFSVADLLKTLFSPFRQDVINTKGAPIGVKLQALGANLISRVFGLIIRTILIVVGLVLVCVNTIFGLGTVLIWPLLPMSPIVAIILMIFSVGVA